MTQPTVTAPGREEVNGIAIGDLVRDSPELEELVSELSKDEDNPPLLLHWIDDNVSAFWNKAVAYSSVSGATVPPSQINSGAQLAGEPNSMALKGWILSHVAATGICGSVIGGPGGTIGLRCTLLQRKNAIAFLRGLGNCFSMVPWGGREWSSVARCAGRDRSSPPR
jgi:hypothetical protein